MLLNRHNYPHPNIQDLWIIEENNLPHLEILLKYIVIEYIL